MDGNPDVWGLLEEMLDSGKTPEEVCRDCPELLPVVRQQWQQFRLMDAQVGALLPEPGTPRSTFPTPPRPHVSGLPQVPGYAVEAELGRGGMGVVYKARHLRLNRTVTLKMLLAGVYAGPQDLARFLREAEAEAGLQHPHVVQVHDVGEHDGRPYFTMELVEGGSLAERLRGTPQPARQAAALVATLAEAVRVAHQGGIVHRDLKPANILLTADGTPKISDFGLARRLQGEAGLTQSGVPVGTPSYMAPEQARGQTHVIGPAADIYALGAILYELLTGRPPFRAETAAETVLQVISQEPATPSRLNAKVPRDLDTICLKCLRKEPEKRYASAGALADDLKRFGEGRPIQARPLGRGARLWRWGRRNPAAAALVATALAVVGLAVGGALWWQRQQAERNAETARHEGRAAQAVEARLEQAAALEKQGRWPEARAALDVAPVVLDSPAQANLRERLRQARADADMVAALEEIRLRLLEHRKSHEPNASRGERLYGEAFRRYGIDLARLEPAEAASRIRSSAIRTTLLAFLYNWVFYWESDADRARLRAVLDLADDDEWRRRLRSTLASYDAAKREELLAAPEARDQPPVLVAGLAGLLIHGPQGEAARALLHKAQQRHPEDFWINFQLGYLLQDQRPQEAVGFLRAAVASRPDSSQAQIMLGRCLREAGDTDAAVSAFRDAIKLNPNQSGARDLARALTPEGKLEEARTVWEKVLASDPPDHDPWYGYAQLCAFLGDDKAYRQARKALLERFSDSPDHWTTAERASLACLLLPATGDELRHAVALVDRAVAAGPKSPHLDSAYPQFVKGLAEYRQGRFAQAIPLLRESAALLPNRAGPRLALAMAQFQSGAPKDARRTLASAVRAYNWKAAQADHATAWVSHVLRREAESLILPNLSAFLRGEYRPHDNDERLAFLGACQFRGLYAAAARLYADAFEADPQLAGRLTTDCRYRTLRQEFPEDDRMEPLDTEFRYLAARCAALAGAGLGKDGAKLSVDERAHWRQQARQWLRADLAQWASTLDSGSGLDYHLAQKALTRWRVETDLSGLLESNDSAELSADERKDDLELWGHVGAVLKRITRHERAVARDPKYADSARESRVLLMRGGRLNDARAAWQTALDANPLDHNDWGGYAALCLFLGREDEYRRARQHLLARFRTTNNSYFAERTARECLLLPASEDELRQAVALIGRAAIADPPIDAWAQPYIMFDQGLAEYRQGRLDRALAALPGGAQGALGASSRLVRALALHRSGQVAEARKTLAAAVLTYDWRVRRAPDQEGWICHVLRREAEGLILPNLTAFLQGKYQPPGNDERLAMLAAQLATWEFRGVTLANERQQVAAWERAIADYRKVVTDQPTNGALATKLAAAYQSAGRTREAIPLLVTASAADPKDTLLSLKVAALQTWFGQEQELAATRRRVLAFAKDTNDATTAERAAKACSLLPSPDTAELEAALALGRTAVKVGKGTEAWDWYLLALGMAEYRTGNYAATEEALLAAEKAGPTNRYVTGTSPFLRAMSLFRQGHEEEARKLAIATAAKMKPLPTDGNNPLAGDPDHDDLILWLVYKEAKAVIKFAQVPPPNAENDKR
jgi:eukaryotic-like serine/threonine-protein kinase